jgi:hypothetical protein
MIVIAKGSIARPDALEANLENETRVLRELKAESIVTAAYRRSAGPGFYFILEGPSIDAVRERIETTLPFVVENVATLEYDEIDEIQSRTKQPQLRRQGDKSKRPATTGDVVRTITAPAAKDTGRPRDRTTR